MYRKLRVLSVVVVGTLMMLMEQATPAFAGDVAYTWGILTHGPRVIDGETIVTNGGGGPLFDDLSASGNLIDNNLTVGRILQISAVEWQQPSVLAEFGFELDICFVVETLQGPPLEQDPDTLNCAADETGTFTGTFFPFLLGTNVELPSTPGVLFNLSLVGAP